MIGETDTLSNAVGFQGNASAVVLDLARVSRIDARGLGVLLRLREQTQSKGIEFRIMNVTKLVQHVLEITKLNTVFEITSERDLAALATTARDEEVVKAGFSITVEA